jgi:hypothetical protein
VNNDDVLQMAEFGLSGRHPIIPFDRPRPDPVEPVLRYWKNARLRETEHPLFGPHVWCARNLLLLLRK